MHRLALRRAEAVSHGKSVGLDAHSVDHQHVAFPTTDRIAGIAGAVRTAAHVSQGLRTRWHRLEIERVLAPANPCDSRRAVRRKRRQSERRRGENAEEQSLAFHLMSPSRPFFLSAPGTAMASLPA